MAADEAMLEDDIILAEESPPQGVWPRGAERWNQRPASSAANWTLGP